MEGRPVDPHLRDRQAEAGEALGRALEAFLDPGAGDDRCAVAEPELGAKGAVLVPETVKLGIECLDLGLHLGVVLSGEAMPELATFLAQALDLRMDIGERCHAPSNEGRATDIPQEYPSSSSRSSSIPK
jgi:hypothetical protein